MSATYTKLRDGWGVRTTEPVLAGQTIQVRTKAGAIKTETIARVLWEGPDKRTGERVILCAIKQQSRGGALEYARAHNYAPGGKTCPNCGQRGCSGAWGDLCDED